MSNVPTNLIPTRITQLPEAPVADPAGYFPIVISGTTYKVQFSQILGNVEVPASRQINTGTGLTGGGSLSADITIAVANGGIGNDQLDTTGVAAGTYGSGSAIPVVTVNSKGRVTNVSTEALVVTGYVPDNRQIVALREADAQLKVRMRELDIDLEKLATQDREDFQLQNLRRDFHLDSYCQSSSDKSDGQHQLDSGLRIKVLIIHLSSVIGTQDSCGCVNTAGNSAMRPARGATFTSCNGKCVSPPY